MASYTMQDLIDIIAKLRGENGCPWDREQTHESIRNGLIEEAYEVSDTIIEGDPMKLADELGDVLLQVVFHAQIGSEEGTFTMEDVYQAVCEKMIRRHPHVFRDAVVSDSEEVLDNWEEIKKSEKGQTSVSEAMKGISRSLPATVRAQKIQKKAEKAGMTLSGAEEEREQIIKAISEITSLNAENLIGETMFRLSHLAKLYHVDAEDSLDQANQNFIQAFENNEKIKKMC